VDRISGIGLVQARGGNGASQSGGGGGGRIALYFNVATNFSFTNLQVNGGSGLNAGGAGTVYTKDGAAAPEIVIRSSGRETPFPPTVGDERVLVDGALVSATKVNVANLTLTNERS
jgi:hypothetical protein